MVEALEILRKEPFDVVVADHYLENDNTCTDLIRSARNVGFSGAFIVMATEFRDSDALRFLKAGAAGIVSKSESPEALIDAIKKVKSGGWSLADVHIKLLIDSIPSNKNGHPQLSHRQRAVLRAVFQGASNKEIAAEFQVTESAVKSTLQDLFRKTGTHTRGQLVRVAMEEFRNEISIP